MRKAKCVRISFALVFLLLCFAMPAKAMPVELQDAEPAILRASGGFSTTVPANMLKTAGSSFPLEIGESITINAHYSPSSASVDFGFIAPDGLFYPVHASGGYINVTIDVTQHGYYTFAIRNNSSSSISVFGIVNY